MMKLIFTNAKKQKKTEVYNKIFEHFQEQYSQYYPSSSFPFTIEQMKTKFKWCVATCKQISLTISTKSGIEGIWDEKRIGQWFKLLYPLIKFWDLCQPKKSIESDSSNNISGLKNLLVCEGLYRLETLILSVIYRLLSIYKKQ